jgi:hypothetical protein
VKILLIPGLLCLVACASHPGGPPDFFAMQTDFAADRSRQTTVVESASSEEACAQVIAVLMDLDCSLVEIDHQLGLVSARSNAHLLPPVIHAAPGPDRRSCLGREVTVSVVPQGRKQFAIRAAFSLADSRADETFRTLLRKSLALSVQQESRSD